MRKILIDTNVILGLLAKREPFHKQSEQVFSLADLGKAELVVSSLSLVNAHGVLSNAMKTTNCRAILGKFKVLVRTFELKEKIIELALSDDHFKYFEDGFNITRQLNRNVQSL